MLIEGSDATQMYPDSKTEIKQSRQQNIFKANEAKKQKTKSSNLNRKKQARLDSTVESNWFDGQGIPPQQFLRDLDAIMNSKYSKRNCFILFGESNSLKSVILRSVVEGLQYCDIYQGVANNFMFQGAIGKDVILWEEAVFNLLQVETFKKVMEGAECSVARKGISDAVLTRTPVLISCNTIPWCMVLGDSAEIQAFVNRCIIYKVKHLDWLDTPHYQQALPLHPHVWKQMFDDYTIHDVEMAPAAYEESSPASPPRKKSHCAVAGYPEPHVSVLDKMDDLNESDMLLANLSIHENRPPLDPAMFRPDNEFKPYQFGPNDGFDDIVRRICFKCRYPVYHIRCEDCFIDMVIYLAFTVEAFSHLDDISKNGSKKVKFGHVMTPDDMLAAMDDSSFCDCVNSFTDDKARAIASLLQSTNQGALVNFGWRQFRARRLSQLYRLKGKEYKKKKRLFAAHYVVFQTHLMIAKAHLHSPPKAQRLCRVHLPQVVPNRPLVFHKENYGKQEKSRTRP